MYGTAIIEFLGWVFKHQKQGDAAWPGADEEGSHITHGHIWSHGVEVDERIVFFLLDGIWVVATQIFFLCSPPIPGGGK